MNTILSLVLLIGCAAPAPVAHGAVVTGVDHELRICVKEGLLRDNAEVRFTRERCEQLSPKVPATRCHSAEVAIAHVVQVLDEHCALVAVPPEAAIQPGDAVEVR